MDGVTIYGLKAPIHLLKFDIETLELLVEQTYLNSVVNSTSPASDRLAESSASGSIILTDEYLYFAEESYLDERYPDLIRFLPQTISTFNAETGSFIKAEFVPENLNNGSSANTLLGRNVYRKRCYSNSVWIMGRCCFSL